MTRFLKFGRYQVITHLLQVNDNTYVDLAAVTPQSLASLQAPQENPYYLGDCACSWEDGISRCNELKYFDCSVFADEGSQEAVTGLNEAVTSRSRGGYACGGPGYILSYAAVKQFVDFEQVSHWR